MRILWAVVCVSGCMTSFPLERLDEAGPVCVEGERCFVSIDSSGQNTCVVELGGALWCWGADPENSLWGGGTERTPRRVDAPAEITYVDLGNRFQTTGCVGSETVPVSCWGSNGNGEAGLGEAVDSSTTFGAVSGIESLRFSKVSVGESATVAISVDGEVFGWGWNGSNRLGMGPSVGNVYDARAIAPSRRAMDISETGSHGCFVDVGGALFCWGSSALGADITGEMPMQVGTGYTRVFAGVGHVCALQDQDLYCWGDNEFGEVGVGTSGDVIERPQLVSPEGVWRSAALGRHQTCAIRTDGSLWCWGLNSQGEAALGDIPSSAEPRRVRVPADPAPEVGWRQVTASEDHGCGIRENGTVYCWGANGNGEASGDIRPLTTPTQVRFPEAT